MTLPATITTNLWSDHLNANHRPVSRVRVNGLDTGADALRSLGDSAANEAWGMTHSSTNSYFMAMVKMQKVGSPTDGVVAKMYDFTDGIPGTLLATSTIVKATQLTTTSRWVRFYFFTPQTVGKIHVAVFRTGSFDASNYYKIDVDSVTAVAANILETHLSSGTWATSDTARLMLLRHYTLPEWYTFSLNKTTNKLICSSSTNAGSTWAEKDSANAPATLSTATKRTISTHGHIGGVQCNVGYVKSATQIELAKFAFDANTWIGGATLTVAAINTNVSGQAPLFMFDRNFTGGVGDGTVIGVYQGSTETIMGTPRRRIKLTRGSSTWDVVGSTNTPNSTLPGTEIHYDLRSCLMDDLGNVYIFYSRSDSSALQLRIFKVNETFCTILSPATSSTSNSDAYPVGLGTNFWRAGEAFVALPYVDGAATKVLTCKAGTDAETAGNWTSTTVVSDAAEVTTSNPAALVADNEAGGKLFMIRVRTDDTLGLSDDAGAGTWSAEAPFRTGQVITGISAGALLSPSAMGLTYFNTAPATDEMQHDHL